MNNLRLRVEQRAEEDIVQSVLALQEEIRAAIDPLFPDGEARDLVRETSAAWVEKVRLQLRQGVKAMLDQVERQNSAAFQATLPVEAEDRAVEQMTAAIGATVRQVLATEKAAFEQELRRISGG